MRSLAGPTLTIAAAGSATLLLAAGQDETAILIGIAGGCGIALSYMRRWITRLEARLTDTTADRRKLAEETAQAQTAHVATMAARERMRAHEAAAEAALEQRLIATEAAIRQKFEETRALELVEAYEAGAMNERDGLHRNGNAARAGLIYLADRRRQPTGGVTANGLTGP
jgi:hypothetical protein